MREHCAVFPRGYLPMDCPVCGRARLEYGVNADGGVVYVQCEKCGANSDDETIDSVRSTLVGRDALMAECYRRVVRAPADGTIGSATSEHSTACGLVAYVFGVHPDVVARAAAQA